MASENKVEIVIDGTNDAGGAFASATAEAKAFQKVMSDAMRSEVRGNIAVSEAIGQHREALRVLTLAEKELARTAGEADAGGGGGFFGGFAKVASGLLGGIVPALGGAFAGLAQSAGQLPGILGQIGAAGGGVGALGLLALAGAAATLTATLFPVIASTALVGAGFGSLAALAIPTFSKISAAVTETGRKGRQAMADLSPAERTLAIDTKQLMAGFGEMAQKLAPSLVKLGITLLDIANKAMPVMLPLARAAAAALGGLFQHISNWLSSGSGQKFLAWVQRDAPGALRTFARVAWDTISAVGRTFSYLWNQGITLQHVVSDVFHWISHEIDIFRSNAVGSVQTVISAWNRIVGFLGTLLARWLGVFGQMTATGNRWTGDVGRWVGQAAAWFGRLPGMISSALSGLAGMLFAAGQHAVQGLINGLGSMLGAVGSMASAIAAKVAGFFGLSPAREGPLSGAGAPEVRGRHFAEALAGGALAGMGDVGAAGTRLAGALGGLPRAGGVYGGGYGPGTVQVVLRIEGGAGNDGVVTAALLELLRKAIRVRGGSTQAVLGRN